MTFAEYKQRKEKLTAAIVRWMMKTQPSSEQLEKVMKRAEHTMGIWWNKIENDPYVKIVDKFIK